MLVWAGSSLISSCVSSTAVVCGNVCRSVTCTVPWKSRSIALVLSVEFFICFSVFLGHNNQASLFYQHDALVFTHVTNGDVHQECLYFTCGAFDASQSIDIAVSVFELTDALCSTTFTQLVLLQIARWTHFLLLLVHQSHSTVRLLQAAASFR